MYIVIDKDEKLAWGFFGRENAAIAWAEGQCGDYEVIEIKELYGTQYRFQGRGA